MSILFINGSPNHHGNTASLAAVLLKRYYTSTPELLAKYAQMVPPVDEQK